MNSTTNRPLLLWSLLGLACALDLMGLTAWLMDGAVLVLVAGADAWVLARSASTKLRRVLPGVVPVGVVRDCALQLETSVEHGMIV